MSPVQQSRSSRSLALGVLGLTLGIVAVLALFVLAIPSLTEDGRVTVQLGDDRFEVGPAVDRAEAIERDGPILIPDPASGVRDIYIQHVGDDPEAGWLVFDSRRPEAGRECTLSWDVEEASFLDPCTDEVVPADGEGLRHYPVEVVDGALVVDLRNPSGTEAVPSPPPTAG